MRRTLFSTGAAGAAALLLAMGAPAVAAEPTGAPTAPPAGEPAGFTAAAAGPYGPTDAGAEVQDAQHHLRLDG